MKKTFFLLLLIFSLITPCYCQLKTGEPSSASAQTVEVWLTIVVHGIINPKPHISLSNVILVMQDTIENSLYAHTVAITRNDPFFYQYHPMQQLGLQKIDMLNRQEGNASAAFAHVFDGMSKVSQSLPRRNIYYTYGWSGLISKKIRPHEAEIFYAQLAKELNTYHQQGIYPKVRVIGYSHGGHIALHLATAHENKSPHNQIETIDEIILLGLPVVCDTDYLVSSPLFKKIFHVYSPGDRVQIVDFLAYHRFLSNRIFKSRSDFTIPKNLYQIELRWKRLARTQTKYTYPNYPQWLIRNANPGHTELFSFGWIYNYRDYMPFYPLPVIVYLGYILKTVESFMEEFRDITVEIRPFSENMTISTPHCKQSHTIPFLTTEQQKKFVSLVEPFRPHNFNVNAFNQRTAQSLLLARQEINQITHKKSLLCSCN